MSFGELPGLRQSKAERAGFATLAGGNSFEAVRAYAPLLPTSHGTAGAKAGDPLPAYPQQVQSVMVADAHYGACRTPEALGVTGVGIALIDVRPGGIRLLGRLLDTRLRAGDVLVLKGSREALEEATARLVGGVQWKRRR